MGIFGFPKTNNLWGKTEPTFAQNAENNFHVLLQYHHDYFIGHTDPTTMPIYISWYIINGWYMIK